MRVEERTGSKKYGTLRALSKNKRADGEFGSAFSKALFFRKNQVHVKEGTKTFYSPRSIISPMEKQRALVLAAGSLGDSLLTLPALRFLNDRFEVTLAATAPYLALGPELFGLPSMVPLEPLLQDLVQDGSLSEKTLEFFSGFSDLYLFFKEPGLALPGKLRTHFGARFHTPGKSFTEFLKEGRWAAEYWMETAMGGPVPADSPYRQARLHIPEELKDRSQTFLNSLSFTAPFILHPGSGSPTKNAPLSFFREAAQKVAGEGGKEVLVLWGEAEQENLLEIRKAFEGIPKVEVLRQPLSLREVAGLMSLSCGYLGNDSGITHLASACGAKTFALFNSTDAKVWGPQANFIILSALKSNLA